MFAYVATRRRGEHVYKYLQICHSVRVDGQPRRKVLGSLGRVDHLSPEQIDALIRSLMRFASPEVQLNLSDGRVRILSSRTCGSILAIRSLWEELGLPELIDQGQQEFSVERAIFRLVANRLVAPQSKLGTCDWQEQDVFWPEPGHFSYQQFLRAMDALLPQKETLEAAVFARVRELFSIPLQLVWYDLTSSYFEGDGVCSLAKYGHSRDHRSDRSQIVLGLAVTQEGLPIAHEIFPGNTADVTTVKSVADDLKTRFGLVDMVLVGDRGLLSASNAAALDERGLQYVMALRTRQHSQVPDVVTEAEANGLERPTDPDAEWTVAEVEGRDGVRHVVVYSAFRSLHDRLVRRTRLKKALCELVKVRTAVAEGRVRSERRVTERVTKILRAHRATRYIRWELTAGRFEYRVDLDYYRQQRRLDGIYVLVSNDATLSAASIVEAYRQLYEVENAFRVLKSLVKMRPMFHHADRRVRSHVLLCVLSYLLAKVLEQRLRRAGTAMTAEQALRKLNRVQAVEYESEGYHIVQMTQPDSETKKILHVLGLDTAPPILYTERIDRPEEAA